MDAATTLLLIGIAIVVLALLWLVLKIIPRAFGVAGGLLEFALEQGFIGLAVYVACWVFLLPAMLIICAVGGLFSMLIEREEAKEAREEIENAAALSRGRKIIEDKQKGRG